ncbi:MAG: putative tRNA pseudouridine synthase D [Candidatus Heimdallarchaeota archaeon LC_3]|nr:MAG: putative tRNA pseudouridine synthase D [Candidatus Heimdallarchaeota archaeon LC_3]
MEDLDKNFSLSSLYVEEISGISSLFHNHKRNLPIFILNRKIYSNFKVDEIHKNHLLINNSTNLEEFKEDHGLFSYHKLKKYGIDTPGAIQIIAHNLKIPENWIGYSGLKDSQAITNQLISIWSPTGKPYRNLDFERIQLSRGITSKFELNFGDLIGNQFNIILDSKNQITNEEKIEISNLMNSIQKKGIPNYFGTQRFGSIRPISHLIGKALLRSDWKLAALSYLVISTNLEQDYIQNTRFELSSSLNFKNFIISIPKKFHYEKRIANELIKTNNYQKAIFSVPKKILSLFIASYQSFIFNWILSKFLTNFNAFDTKLENIPLIGYETDFNEYPEWVNRDIEEILKEDKINLHNFNQKESWIKISGSKRKAIIYPRDFKFKIYSNRMNLEFSLNKGSYATSLIREIVNNRKNVENRMISDQIYKNYNKKAIQFFIFPENCKSLFNL